MVIFLLNEYWANTYMSLLLSGSSCLQTSSSTALSVSCDRHVNGEGSPVPRQSRMEKELFCMSHLQQLSALLPVNCWMLVEWPKLTRFCNTKVTAGYVIHQSWAVNPPEVKQRENLCRIKQGYFHFIINTTFRSLRLLIYVTSNTKIVQ